MGCRRVWQRIMFVISSNVLGIRIFFSPTVYLAPEIIEYQGKHIIHIHVPPSSEVHSYKKVLYDRVNDADIKVTATSQIAQMYIRKQNIFTEKKIYPYIRIDDFRLDLLPRLRIMADNNSGNNHPWGNMSDEELMRSAGLYGKNLETGDVGYNLAAVKLLGKDDVIADVAPAYLTDALLRRDNVDRYDDREIIKTNLIESYERLMEFGKKHLPDKFYLEDDQRKSLRSIITPEIIANTLIHREYTSSYHAKFIIGREYMRVENANRAIQEAVLTPEAMEPNPKNPIIASFFRNIGYADQLGSGVRNLFKYSKIYSGEDPKFEEGDIFRITVAIPQSATQSTTQSIGQLSLFPMIESQLLELLEQEPEISQKKIAEKLEMNLNTVKYHMRKLQNAGVLAREGTPRKGKWIVKK